MKTITHIIVTAVVVATTVIFSFGKTRNMTLNQFELFVHHMDSRLVGTWEKDWSNGAAATTEFCQFNSNGTFISFQKTADHYMVTGRGKWTVENGTILIQHGTEKSIAVVYETNSQKLTFGHQVSYSKPAPSYACK